MSPKRQTTVSVAVHSPGAACQCLVHSQPAGTFQRLTDVSDLELAVTFLGFLICKETEYKEDWRTRPSV